MSSFIDIVVSEKYPGVPGLVEEYSVNAHINMDNVTFIGEEEDDPNMSFVKLSCGAALMVKSKYKDMVKLIKSNYKSMPGMSVDHPNVFVKFDNITFVTQTEDPESVIVRLVCGTSLLVDMDYQDLISQLGQNE